MTLVSRIFILIRTRGFAGHGQRVVAMFAVFVMAFAAFHAVAEAACCEATPQAVASVSSDAPNDEAPMKCSPGCASHCASHIQAAFPRSENERMPSLSSAVLRPKQDTARLQYAAVSLDRPPRA